MRKLKEIVFYFLHPVLSLMRCERAHTSSNYVVPSLLKDAIKNGSLLIEKRLVLVDKMKP